MTIFARIKIINTYKMKKLSIILLSTLAMVVVGIMSSCSDDTPTTGTICVVFSSWEREWNK